MKWILGLLAAMMLMSTGCISRTVSDEYVLTGRVKEDASGVGLEKELVWFWEDDFKRPE